MPKKKPNYFKFNFAILVELVAVVMVWRGTWMLLDHFLLPHHPFISSVLSIVLGLGLLLLDDKLLKEIKHWL